MSWQLIIGFRIIFSHFLVKILQKKIAGLPSKIRNLSWQYFFAALLSLVFAWVSHEPHLIGGQIWLWIFILGMFNSVACYCQWCAMDISLSKSAVITWVDDLIPIVLGYVLLGESKYINIQLITGLAICLSATIIIALARERGEYRNLVLLKYVAIYSVIWGIAHFLKRKFALDQVSYSTFLTGWYFGSYFGTICMLQLVKIVRSEKLMTAMRNEIGDKISLKRKAATALLAFGIWIPFALDYWVKHLAPLIVTEPISLITEMVIPAFVGFYVFKEIEELSRVEKIAFLVGFVGIIIIGLSY